MPSTCDSQYSRVRLSCLYLNSLEFLYRNISSVAIPPSRSFPKATIVSILYFLRHDACNNTKRQPVSLARVPSHPYPSLTVLCVQHGRHAISLITSNLPHPAICPGPSSRDRSSSIARNSTPFLVYGSLPRFGPCPPPLMCFTGR